MTTSHADLPVVVDRAGTVPLAAQISAQVQAAVAAGVLRTGDRLPSTRGLAAALSVSRTVVTTAYVQLFAEGWLEGRHGSGTYVADVAPAADPDGRAEPRRHATPRRRADPRGRAETGGRVGPRGRAGPRDPAEP